MTKMLSFVQLALIAAFAVFSYLFYGKYLAWNDLMLVGVYNTACALSFGAAGALAVYAVKGADVKTACIAGAVSLAVYEALLWGILTVINRDGTKNRPAINTAYNVVLTLFAVIVCVFFICMIRRSGKAVNITALALTALVFVLAACVPNSYFLKNVLKGDGDLYKDCYVMYDRRYGEHERQLFDMIIPKNTAHPEGLILFIHGGGWIAGDKDVYGSDLKSWARKGYIAASMSYHYVSADTHMDVLMEDITLALSAIKTAAAEKGFELKKCLLTGGSAGGHMSLLYAYKHGKDAPVQPCAVVSYCGPADLTNRGYIFGNRLGNEDFMSGLMSFVCGEQVDKNDLEKTKDALWRYSPAAFAENAVPTMFVHGECDSVVPFEDTAALDKRLSESGVEHDFVIYPHSDHDLAADPDCAAQAYKLFEEYAEKYL